jgi:hypothetical protein
VAASLAALRPVEAEEEPVAVEEEGAMEVEEAPVQKLKQLRTKEKADKEKKGNASSSATTLKRPCPRQQMPQMQIVHSARLVLNNSLAEALPCQVAP